MQATRVETFKDALLKKTCQTPQKGTLYNFIAQNQSNLMDIESRICYGLNYVSTQIHMLKTYPM